MEWLSGEHLPEIPTLNLTMKKAPSGRGPPPPLYAIIRENYRELPSPPTGDFDPQSYNATQIPYYLLHTAGCETSNNQSKRDMESVY